MEALHRWPSSTPAGVRWLPSRAVGSCSPYRIVPGRNEKKAYAVLLYESRDIKTLENLSENRYPSFSEIKRVYQALANYLQIPQGIGEGIYYNFDIIDFAKKFKLDSQLVWNTIKTLEQEEHISFTENIFIPSKVEILADKTNLEDVEKTHPSTEITLKTLLRSYAGILNNLVLISEKQIAKVSYQSYEKVIEDLKVLNQLKIINYVAKKKRHNFILLIIETMLKA